MSQGYTFPHEEAARDRWERTTRMKLIHLIYAVVTLAAVSAIALAGPSQAGRGAGDLYLERVVAS
jgi:hypothetical protein